MKKLTSSIYDFETLIEKGYLYVDKTEFLWKLVQNYGETYFLARPRRFGKSLVVSTLKAIFEGRKELFEGLAISKTDFDWQPHPVIHLDMSGFECQSAEQLEQGLSRMLLESADKNGISIEHSSAVLMFRELITKLSRTEKVVILIDEYDKPILNNLGKPEADQILESLKTFYTIIKSFNDRERFVFITGVSKFSHVSMFSGFNNPTDLSEHHAYATMFGYTQAEVEKYFAEYIDQACEQTGMNRENLLAKVKEWYDGFRFVAKAAPVYNPVSLVKFFDNGAEFKNYWFTTGTPSFLMKLSREKNFDIEQAITEPVVGLAFNAFEIDKVDPLTLLLQTGYLTIKSSLVDEDDQTLYYLDFPNKEVKNAFRTYLINDYTGLSESEVGVTVLKLRKALKAEDFGLVIDLLKTFYASISYDVAASMEGRYQLLFVALFNLLGFKVEPESRTNVGRIDAVLETQGRVYIFEFKVDQSADAAITQIKDKNYFQKFKHSGKQITIIGIDFDSKARQIADWQLERV